MQSFMALIPLCALILSAIIACIATHEFRKPGGWGLKLVNTIGYSIIGMIGAVFTVIAILIIIALIYFWIYSFTALWRT